MKDRWLMGVGIIIGAIAIAVSGSIAVSAVRIGMGRRRSGLWMGRRILASGWRIASGSGATAAVITMGSGAAAALPATLAVIATGRGAMAAVMAAVMTMAAR